MRIGITGHQAREGTNWNWVRDTIERELDRFAGISAALSSLAAGTDQLFAEIVLERNIKLISVVPLPGYEAFFDAIALAKYRELSSHAQEVKLNSPGPPKRAFEAAGKYIVDNSDHLFAVWDHRPAEGVGGTADIVSYASIKNVPTTVIDPVAQLVTRNDDAL